MSRQRKVRPRSLRVINFLGHALLPSEWARITGIHPSAIAQRVARGWDPIRAITTLEYGIPGVPKGIDEILNGKSPEEVLLDRGIDWRGRPLHPDYVREARARLARAKSAAARRRGFKRAIGWREAQALAEEFKSE
jgi:hypothetical protein